MEYYDEKGVQYLGLPWEYNYSRDYFYDTRYHLNSTGQKARTDTIMSHLLAFLNLSDSIEPEPRTRQIYSNLVSEKNSSITYGSYYQSDDNSFTFDDWYNYRETDGLGFRWSAGGQTEIRFSLSDISQDIVLTLGIFSLGRQDIIVKMNGRQVYRDTVAFSKSNPGQITISIPKDDLLVDNVMQFILPTAKPSNAREREIAIALTALQFDQIQ